MSRAVQLIRLWKDFLLRSLLLLDLCYLCLCGLRAPLEFAWHPALSLAHSSKGPVLLWAKKIYIPWERGGELAQIYEHRLQWQGPGSCYLTFEQRMWKKIGDGGNRKLEQQRGGERMRNEWDTGWSKIKKKCYGNGGSSFMADKAKETKSSLHPSINSLKKGNDLQWSLKQEVQMETSQRLWHYLTSVICFV